jgi:hypothetical protein
MNQDLLLSPYYLLGILNSSLISFYIKNNSTPFRGGYFALNRQYIEKIPIQLLKLNNPQDSEQHDRMTALVERMLDLHKRDPQTPQEADRLQREITATDGAIDKLVYELYGLTEEEVRIVEGGS